VRRAKLYYLRDRVGKSARLKQEFVSTKPKAEAPPAAPKAAAAPAAAPAEAPAAAA
jgi:hypothetical protein